MEHKDMLHATYRFKRAVCYRNKRHLPLRDRCHVLGMLMKKQIHLSKLRWDLKDFAIVYFTSGVYN
jgi:hypothetical protein